jgi:hypothetical protein
MDDREGLVSIRRSLKKFMMHCATFNKKRRKPSNANDTGARNELGILYKSIAKFSFSRTLDNLGCVDEFVVSKETTKANGFK